jgi:arginyl-tRNA--protein-N-Asp/Glu arginylyltransferase
MNSDYDSHVRSSTLSFYASMPHECSYLPNRTAISVFADPAINMTNNIYGKLAEIGFRRSGNHVYAPKCNNCQACIPVRIPVDSFTPNRTQRRTLTRNASIDVVQTPACFNQRHYQLYRRYLSKRHMGGGMDNPTPDSYMEFLTCHWSNTSFFEFQLDGEVIAVSVVDHLPRALSAVYTFFDPDLSHLSLGSYAILWLITEARMRGHPWLYLGYWIRDSRKMAYKDSYRPIEALVNGHWRVFPTNEPITPKNN